MAVVGICCCSPRSPKQNEVAGEKTEVNEQLLLVTGGSRPENVEQLDIELDVSSSSEEDEVVDMADLVSAHHPLVRFSDDHDIEAFLANGEPDDYRTVHFSLSRASISTELFGSLPAFPRVSHVTVTLGSNFNTPLSLVPFFEKNSSSIVSVRLHVYSSRSSDWAVEISERFLVGLQKLETLQYLEIHSKPDLTERPLAAKPTSGFSPHKKFWEALSTFKSLRCLELSTAFLWTGCGDAIDASSLRVLRFTEAASGLRGNTRDWNLCCLLDVRSVSVRSRGSLYLSRFNYDLESLALAGVSLVDGNITGVRHLTLSYPSYDWKDIAVRSIIPTLTKLRTLDISCDSLEGLSLDCLPPNLEELSLQEELISFSGNPLCIRPLANLRAIRIICCRRVKLARSNPNLVRLQLAEVRDIVGDLSHVRVLYLKEMKAAAVQAVVAACSASVEHLGIVGTARANLGSLDVTGLRSVCLVSLRLNVLITSAVRPVGTLCMEKVEIKSMRCIYAERVLLGGLQQDILRSLCLKLSLELLTGVCLSWNPLSDYQTVDAIMNVIAGSSKRLRLLCVSDRLESRPLPEMPQLRHLALGSVEDLSCLAEDMPKIDVLGLPSSVGFVADEWKVKSKCQETYGCVAEFFLKYSGLFCPSDFIWEELVGCADKFAPY